MTKKEYCLYVGKKKVTVSKEIYDVYFQSIEKYKYELEKERKNNVVSYDALDTDEHIGENTLADPNAVPVIDEMIRKEIIAELNRCLELLSKDELELIRGIFYLGMSERELSQKIGISNIAIHKKKMKILKKLRNFIKI
jgi:RNA polymerase sigma factor (sigma-70 family)